MFGGKAVFRFLAVTTSAEAVKPKYSGNFSAVGGFSFFGGNDLGGGGKPKIWHITASAHQGDNFTAGKLPTITLGFFNSTTLIF